MEIIINVALRKAPGQRSVPIHDIQVRDVFAKMPEEVEQEIQEQIEFAITKAYLEIGAVDSPEAD